MNIDRYEKAREAIEGVIRSSIWTRARFKRWPSTEEVIPPDAEPNARAIPACRVEIRPLGPVRRLTTEADSFRQEKCEALIRVWAAGPGDAELLRLMARVEAAFDPSDATELEVIEERLEAAGIWSLTTPKPSLPPRQPTPDRVIQGVMVFSCILCE